jgi:MerR family transcriptional regulator, light-induced transcriptional regulator
MYVECLSRVCGVTLPNRAARWRIGQLSSRVGVSPELLRAWEQRYGLIRPERSSGGFRLYSAADEARVKRVLALKETGLATAEAIDVALAEDSVSVSPAAEVPERPLPATAGAADEIRSRLTSALESLDEAATQAAVDRAFAAVGVDAAVQAVVLPALRDIGEGWERGRVDVAQEHYATNVLQARLMTLARGWGEGQGPHAVLACAPGELHVIGLLCLGLALRERGWRVLFLGADTPIAAVERMVDELAPSLVGLSAVLPERFLLHEEELRALAARTMVGLGGAGATQRVAARLGVLAPQRDPVAAAEEWGRSAHPGTRRP